jgi:serine protease
LVVASAGNRYGEPSRPAKCSGVVGVVALNRDGFKANYASFGAALASTGLATVGGDDRDGRWSSLADSGLLSISNSGRQRPEAAQYGRFFGSSFAAPAVAGVAALMLSINSQLTVAQLQEGLRKSARPHVRSDVAGVNECSTANPGRCLCTAQTCGAGVLDAVQALMFAQSPSTYAPPVWPVVNIDTAELRAAAALGADRGQASGGSLPAATASASPLQDEGSGATSPLFWVLLAAVAAGLQRRRNLS